MRLGIALNRRPMTWPRPTNISAISAKKTPAMTSIGTTQANGSRTRYSVPK